MELPLWLGWFLAAIIIVLVLLLWSAMRGRKVHLTITDITTLREGLPSIVGATHGTLVDGNSVEVLQNGDGLFPRLLADIAGAKETIHLESYVWSTGKICESVAGALAAKAREGVSVRVLLDASGSAKMDRKLLELMRGAGCKVAKYRPFRIGNLARVNSRDHRKLVIVDGRIGYTFGHGFSDQWVGNAQDGKHWRDTGVRVEGPIVAAMQSCFTENWVEETAEVLAGDRFFPALKPVGTKRAHLAYHFNHGSASAVDLLFRLSFATAQRELLIQNPYLSPDPEVLELLGKAADRGVKVWIMLPGEITDSPVVRHAGHRYYTELLRRGVRIFEYEKTLSHQKIIVVDGEWSHIGSTNLDNRSFESNDEVSLGVLDRDTAAELKAAFLDDLKSSKEVALADWEKRTFLHRLQDLGAYRLNEFM